MSAAHQLNRVLNKLVFFTFRPPVLPCRKSERLHQPPDATRV